MFFTIQRRWSGEINIQIRTAVNAACQRNLSECHFWHACHTFASPGLEAAVNKASPYPLFSHIMNYLSSTFISYEILLLIKPSTGKTIYYLLPAEINSMDIKIIPHRDKEI